MNKKRLIPFLLVLLLPACTKYTSHNQATGFMAPIEHKTEHPLYFCHFNLLLTDPLYSTKDRELVEPVLSAQVLKYFNADGRVQVADKECGGNTLKMDFIKLTDDWTEGKWLFLAEANLHLSYEQKVYEFSLKEQSGHEPGSESIYSQYRSLDNANSTRNRTRFMEKLIVEIEQRIKEGKK